jgi:hypothetical protein
LVSPVWQRVVAPPACAPRVVAQRYR